MPPASPIPLTDPTKFLEQHAADLHEGLWQKVNRLPERLGLFPFTIVRMEEFGPLIRFPLPVERTPFYEVLLLAQGTVVRTDGLHRYVVEGPAAYFHTAGHIASTEACSPDATGYYCQFAPDFLLRAAPSPLAVEELPFFQVAGHPIVPLPVAGLAELQALLHQAETVYLGDVESPETLLGALLYVFCLQARKYALPVPAAAEAAALPSAVQLTHRFKTLLAEHITSRRTVAEYADLLAVTPNYLTRCIKTVTGQPASSLITDMRLLEAKVLLRQTELPVATIAARLGFDDPAYFGRLVKKRTGRTPGEFRKSG